MRKRILIVLSVFMSLVLISCVGFTSANFVKQNKNKGDEKEPEQKQEIKHTINFHLNSNVYLENTALEYVEGEGLEKLPIPTVNNENTDEEWQFVFVYWYTKGERNEPNEVFTSISKAESRDLELYPLLVYKDIYDRTFEKYNFEIEDGRAYPSTKRKDFDSFPTFNIYGVIELDKEENVVETDIDGTTYYQVKCQIVDIYDMFKLTEDLGIKDVWYEGNCNSDGTHTGKSYFVNISEDAYLKYNSCDKFIVPLNIKYNYGFDETYNFGELITVRYPLESEAIATIEYQVDENKKEVYFDFYPIVDGKVLVEDQSSFIDYVNGYQSYIIRTYKTYICDRLSDEPTFEEFDSWLIKCYNRIIQRTRYGAHYFFNW